MISLSLIFYGLGIGSVLGLAFFIIYELYYKPKRFNRLIKILVSLGLSEKEALGIWTESGLNLSNFEKDVKELVSLNDEKLGIQKQRKVSIWERVLKNKLRKNC